VPPSPTAARELRRTGSSTLGERLQSAAALVAHGERANNNYSCNARSRDDPRRDDSACAHHQAASTVRARSLRCSATDRSLGRDTPSSRRRTSILRARSSNPPTCRERKVTEMFHARVRSNRSSSSRSRIRVLCAGLARRDESECIEPTAYSTRAMKAIALTGVLRRTLKNARERRRHRLRLESALHVRCRSRCLPFEHRDHAFATRNLVAVHRGNRLGAARWMRRRPASSGCTSRRRRCAHRSPFVATERFAPRVRRQAVDRRRQALRASGLLAFGHPPGNALIGIPAKVTAAQQIAN
jgi:hypothetical protein